MESNEELILTFTKDVERIRSELPQKVSQFNSLDLIANITHYNHIHSVIKYEDYRGDKQFFISEALAIETLKGQYIKDSNIKIENFMNEVMSIQKLVDEYCTKLSMLNFLIAGISGVNDSVSHRLSSEEHTVRNPGLPDHHFIISTEMFEPLEDIIKSHYGFTIKESVIFRECYNDYINERYFNEIERIKDSIPNYIAEIIEFKKTGLLKDDSDFDRNSIIAFSKMNNKTRKEQILNSIKIQLHYNLKEIYTFNTTDLSEYTGINVKSLGSILELLSVEFNFIPQNEEIFKPVSILKTKPIIKHDKKYIVPSIPLLNFSIENVIEEGLKKNTKIFNRYTKTKHDYLLNKGLELLESLLPNSTVFPPNLYYSIDDKTYETDGLILWDSTLIIIEAKGIKISTKAKKGHKLKIQDHLDDIFKDSYKQAKRTHTYIQDSDAPKFKTKKSKKFDIDKSKIDNYIFLSLTLEPVGNISLEFKVNENLGYFDQNNFPFIISLYDLIVIADIIENPILFFYYIKRRKLVLSENYFSTYEELDLFGYFIYDLLYVEHIIEEAKIKNIDKVYLENATDEINDYYMYKFGHKEIHTPKPKINIDRDLNKFLLCLDKSPVQHRLKIALLVLEFSNKSHKVFFKKVRKIKKSFSRDRKGHDCTIYSKYGGGLGLTFMTLTNREKLDEKLYNYCIFKQRQLNADTWIGIGDVSLKEFSYNFKSMFICMNKTDDARISI